MREKYCVLICSTDLLREKILRNKLEEEKPNTRPYSVTTTASFRDLFLFENKRCVAFNSFDYIFGFYTRAWLLAWMQALVK